jgi:hypothetical protein
VIPDKEYKFIEKGIEAFTARDMRWLGKEKLMKL